MTVFIPSNNTHSLAPGRKFAEHKTMVPPLGQKKTLTSSLRSNLEKGGSERFLQSTDMRRRYMRRGSKTSCMLKVPLKFELEYFPRVKFNRRASCPAVTNENNSAWNVGSAALVDLALIEVREGMIESGMVSRQLEPDSSEKNTTVSFLTSALAVSSIQNGANDGSFSSPKSSMDS
jgi:hypothetical protein